MTSGIRVYDSAGALVFDENSLSLRVIDIIRLNYGKRSSPLTVNAPKARAAHAVIVQARARYPHKDANGHYGYNPPVVKAYDGYIVLSPLDWPYSQTSPGVIDCSCDLILVEFG